MLLQLWGGAHINWWCNGCEQLQAEVTRSKIMIQILTNITGSPTLKSTHLPLEIKSPFCENQCWMSQSLMKPLVSNMSWPDSQQTDRNQVPSKKKFNSQKKGWLPGWSSEECLIQDAYYFKQKKRHNPFLHLKLTATSCCSTSSFLREEWHHHFTICHLPTHLFYLPQPLIT